VPAALLLALLTGIFDFIPVLGIFLTTIPMALIALSVSTTAAIATLAFNAVYNIFENYYLAPKVYGNQMRLSSLAVVLAFAVGAELGGVVGALIEHLARRAPRTGRRARSPPHRADRRALG
jgi:predicted PurR-regulated permease PerM